LTAAPHPFLDETIVRRLVDDGMVLFLALEGDGTIVWIGESVGSILGRSSADLIGTNALDVIHPEDADVVIASLAEDARNAEDRILAVVRLARDDGTWATLEFGGIDLRDADGSGLFLVWGRSHEAPGRLLSFLGSLLEGGDLVPLLHEVVRWSDVLSPHGHTAVAVTDPDGRPIVVGAEDLPPTLTRPDAIGPSLLDRVGRGAPEGSGPDRPVPVQLGLDELDSIDPVLAASARQARMHQLWLVPIDGEADAPQERRHGVVAIWRSRPGPMMATHARHYDQVATLARLALEWATTRAELHAAATSDPLTGVANRAQLASRMQDGTSDLSALLFCDLDDFKAVNDEHGHLAGDRVLQAIASRMAGTARPQDLLVRLGGDEFAVWCPDIAAPSEAQEVAGRLVEVLGQPIVVEGHPIAVGCSVGLALIEGPVRGEADVDHIIGQADRALYRAKRAGKHRWAVAEARLDRR
jgi:diguanylate cyclase (GGDEF)-like protein/PAS domain S-box-containing protein